MTKWGPVLALFSMLAWSCTNYRSAFFEETETPATGEEIPSAVDRDGGTDSEAVQDSDGPRPRDTHCDDGTQPTCKRPTPICNNDEILAYQNNCTFCVNPATCRPWGQPNCISDQDCPATEVCDPCGTSNCSNCDNCIKACRPHGCATEASEACSVTVSFTRPECGPGNVAVIQKGCWSCRELGTCSAIRSTYCDDGTQPTCMRPTPNCQAHELMALQKNCYACVNPVSCVPWGVPGCTNDSECRAGRLCKKCAVPTCPQCAQCLPACVYPRIPEL